jgi:hypothetical protein
MASSLERFRAKWAPVRVKKTRQNKNLELRFCFNQNRNALMRLAEDAGERQHEDFIAAIVGDMHDPVAPIFPICGHDVGASETLGVLAGLDQVADGGTALVDQYVFCVGAVEEDVRHVPHPLPNESRKAKFTSAESDGESGQFRGIRTI